MSKLKLQATDGSAGTVSLKAPASTTGNAEFELTLPGNAGSNGQLLSTNGSGVLSWSDDNSGVSLSGSTNNTIATVSGANALVGEANLTFDGSKLVIANTSSTDANTTTDGAGFNSGTLYHRSRGDSAGITGQTYSNQIISSNGTNVALEIYTIGATGTPVVFGTNSLERLRITSAGKVGINEDTPVGDLHVTTAGSSQEDGVLYVGGSNSTLGLQLSYDQSGTTAAKITANSNYSNASSKLSLCVDENNNADQLELTGNGNVKIGDGNLIIGTSGHGIDFSANSHAGGMTSELLDSYEEGTFTPVVRAYFSGAWNNSGFNTSPTEATGTYTKVGNVVTITGRVRGFQLDNDSQGAYAGFGGLPFTAKSGTLYPVIATFYNSAMADGHAGFYIGSSSTLAYTGRSDSAAGHTTWNSGGSLEFWYYSSYYTD